MIRRIDSRMANSPEVRPPGSSAATFSEGKSGPVACAHCGLPVPAGLDRKEPEPSFCCGGCATAWTLIHESGLDVFYRMVDSAPESQTLQSRAARQDFATLDDPSFGSRFVERDDSGRCRTKMLLEGIHCAACVWLVEKLPELVPGVMEARVNWTRQTLDLRWQDDTVRLSRIAEWLHGLGYTPHPLRESDKARQRERENRDYLVRIGIAGAAAGNNMLIAASLYLGMFSYMSLDMETLLRVASCVVGLVSLLWPGRIFLQGAWNALRTRTPHMDLPIALGLLVGTAAGVVNTVRGAGEIYFDSLSVLVFLLLVGRWIQFRQQNRAADAIEMLFRLTPQRARRWKEGRATEVPVEQIEVGDQVEVLPGDRVPVDARIDEGEAMLDQSLLSGESDPVACRVGDPVAAGTHNVSGRFLATATAVGEDTRISQIVGLVERAAGERPAMVEWANRIGGWFVVAVIGLAALTGLVWLFRDPSVAIDRSVALLIVACPCALALATPLALAVGLARLAHRGVMVKSGDVIQSLARPGLIWLDKTGTVTEGQPRIVEWHGEPQWRQVAEAVESQFSHPVATAFRHDRSDQANRMTVANACPVPGGVQAVQNGCLIQIGNRRMLEAAEAPLGAVWLEVESRLLSRGLSPCWVVADGEVVGLAGIGDRLRSDSLPTIRQLESLGWQVGLLSGDHPEVVGRTAEELDLDPTLVRGGVTPEDKLALVREGFFKGTVVMVGDGVNDSAALAAATVGIAMHGGAEASLAAAPVYLGEDGLGSILDLIRSSESTSRIIRLNLIASLAYNAAGASLAMLGWINPLVAAVLMPLSSLTVIAISLRAGGVAAAIDTDRNAS